MGCHATKQRRKASETEHLSLPDTHEEQVKQKLLTPDTRLEQKKQKSPQPLEKGKLAELFSLEHQQIYRNKKFQSDYFITQEKIMDKGMNGKVFVVEHKITGIKRIAKIARNSINEEQLEKITNDLQALKRLDHPNLIRLFEFYNDEKHLYLVEEYCEGGNLFERLSDELKSEEKVHITFVFQQVLSALSYLHSQKIIHKNIKTSNIVVSSKDKFLVKLIGFEDLSDMFFEKEKDISYRAPETYRDNFKWNQSADIWSAGVVLFELMTGVHPFREGNQQRTIDNIKRRQIVPLDEWNQLNGDARQLVTQMLDFDPKLRPYAKDCLKFKYFQIIRRTSMKISSVLCRMREFQKKNELKQILLSLMIDYLLSKEDRDKMAQAFYQIDTNNDGRISKNELFQQMKITLDDEDAKKEVEKIFSTLDVNGNELLEFNEFLVASCNQKEFLTEQNLLDFFQKLDRDHSNHISANELKVFFCNTNLSQQEWQQIIQMGDKDFNNKISYEEFVNLMTDQSQ